MPKSYKDATTAEFAVLDYDPETGLFKWKSGELAGRAHPRGYLRISVSGYSILSHRLAWFLTYGYWPKELDHINLDKTDNRISNLRECSHAQNLQNRRKLKGTASPLKGAHRFRAGWVAKIVCNGQRTYLGVFKTDLEAHEAYCKAASSLHGEFANIKA
jgi:hypothetical protein